MLAGVMKIAIKNYLGKCSVLNCDRIIAIEKLICKIKVGYYDYHVCLEHSKRHFSNPYKISEIDIDNWVKFPTQEDIKKAINETAKMLLS